MRLGLAGMLIIGLFFHASFAAATICASRLQHPLRSGYIWYDLVAEVVAIQVSNFPENQHVTYEIQYVYKGDIAIGETFFTPGVTEGPDAIRVDTGSRWLYFGRNQGDMMSGIGGACWPGEYIPTELSDFERAELRKVMTGETEIPSSGVVNDWKPSSHEEPPPRLPINN